MLVVYDDRDTLKLLRNSALWELSEPPVDLIAMTADEEKELDFLAVTAAVRLRLNESW